MDFTVKNIDTFDKLNWNNILKDMEGPAHLCLWNSLDYYSAYPNIKNLSFVIINENKILGLVPLALNRSTQKIKLEFANKIIFAPIFRKNISSSLRKKIYKFIFDYLKEKFKKKLNICIQYSPIFFKNNMSFLSSKNQFELIPYSYDYLIHNTLIQDLKIKTEDMLKNMSKYHRKNINRTSKMEELKFEVISSHSKKELIRKKFNEFNKFHFISAGKATRPKKTWNIMLKKIFDDEADLFSLNFKNKSISYLYCAKYLDYAWGWSQVNLEKYEKISPRHFLEWKSMLYYKKKNFSFYEIGERYEYQSKFKPTKKEITISEFKEKYGSDKYPKAYFRVNI